MAGKALTSSLLDRKLLEAASNGASAVEMEEQFGIPAAQAMLRVKELLENGRNVFDEIEQRQLLVLSLKRMKQQIESAGVDDQNPKAIEAYTKSILAIDRISTKQTQITEAELNTVTQAQARALLGLVETAYARARKLLADEYGKFIDLDMIDAAFQDGLREAAQIESK